MAQNEICIFGMGSISPLGVGLEAASLAYGTPASFINKKIIDGVITPVGELSNDSEKQLKSTYIKQHLDKVAKIAVFTGVQAVKGLEDRLRGVRTGVSIGSSRGATSSFEKAILQYAATGKVGPRTSPLTTLGGISSELANVVGAYGPVVEHSMTCSTAIASFIQGISWIKSGMCQAALVGGAEAAITGFTIAQMKALRIYSDLDDNFPCQPFGHSGKNTFVLGEGGATFFIAPAALFPDLKPLATIVSICFGHEVTDNSISISPTGENFKKAMKMALDEMDQENNIDLIMAHAPGTLAGDEAELSAIGEIFGSSPVRVYSNKWKMGHLFGAAGALSIEGAIAALHGAKLAQLLYQKSPIKENTKQYKNQLVMVNSAGFGGQAASIILKH